jgi:preprotein translocase subunit SecA
MIESVVENSLIDSIPDDSQPHDWNIERTVLVLRDIAGVVFKLDDIEGKYTNPGKLRLKLVELVADYYARKKEKLGEKLVSDLEKWSLLSSIDEKWRDHLYALDHLKSGIGLRAYAQRDPLVEFKKEAFSMFEELLDSIDKQVVRQILSLWPASQIQRQQGPSGRAVHPGIMSPSDDPRSGIGRNAEGQQQTVKRDEQKVGRNEPCPCGSGKKYKQCCGG